MRRSSVRLRITAAAAVLVAAVLVLAAAGLVVAQRWRLTATIDAALVQRADDIAALIPSAPGGRIELASPHEEGFAQIVAGDEVVAATPNLAGAGPLSISYEAGAPQAIKTEEVSVVDDDDFRVLSRTVGEAGAFLVLHVGTTFDVVAESTAALTPVLLAAVPLIVAVFAAAVWWMVGRTLRPVEAIRAEVAAIGAADVSRRVPQPPGDDEIGELARTMNSMLGRLDSALSQERRFVADASHELRSPLTRMRAELEVDLAATDVDATQRRRLRSVLEEVVALQRLVEDLLELSQADAGVGPVMQPVDLDDVVLATVNRFGPRAGITVDASRVSAAHVSGDPRQLARVVANLTENALRHAASRVSLGLEERDGAAVLTVDDDGVGIPRDRAAVVFERFARVDEARGRTEGGTGLGLAIARELVERHGGTLTIDLDHRPGARFVVCIPLP